MMNNDEFDRSFNDMQKTAKRAMGVVFFVWAAGAIVSLAVMGGIAYVAIHFLQKVW